MWPVPLAQVWTHWGLNWFCLPNTIFAICLNFQQQNPLKNQYVSNVTSENCKINSIRSDSPKAFQQHQQQPPQIPIQFSVSILFNFHYENDTIITNFHTIAPNNLKPNHCNSTHWQLSPDTKMRHEAPWFGRYECDKQNKLPCFIDRYHNNFWTRK